MFRDPATMTRDERTAEFYELCGERTANLKRFQRLGYSRAKEAARAHLRARSEELAARCTVLLAAGIGPRP